ncbi:YqaE/Pmp3 family membrane protein [Stieleria maiorica]|nr:YqaE/Pmp3 family membrane protein [Stieleria maiorica]
MDRNDRGNDQDSDNASNSSDRHHFFRGEGNRAPGDRNLFPTKNATAEGRLIRRPVGEPRHWHPTCVGVGYGLGMQPAVLNTEATAYAPHISWRTTMEYVRLLIAFILPPVAVFMQFGIGKHFWINLVLTLLGFVPGMLHAVYIMAARPPGLARLR